MKSLFYYLIFVSILYIFSCCKNRKDYSSFNLMDCIKDEEVYIYTDTLEVIIDKSVFLTSDFSNNSIITR